jgi:hypothetical protein
MATGFDIALGAPLLEHLPAALRAFAGRRRRAHPDTGPQPVATDRDHASRTQ